LKCKKLILKRINQQQPENLTDSDISERKQVRFYQARLMGERQERAQHVELVKILMALGDKDSFAIAHDEVYTGRSSFITQQSSHSSANLGNDSSLKKRRPAFFVKSARKFSALRLKKA